MLGCEETSLPPSPPPPGTGQIIGQAIGQISLSNLPSWAAQAKYTDISPYTAMENDSIKVSVEKPSDINTDFYIFGFMYIFNKKAGVWEKISPVVSESGKITSDWVKDEAVFEFNSYTSKFDYGKNYFVNYWCIDTEEYDTREQKIWQCNGNKWGLGYFELERKGYSEFLIEQDIGSNTFNSSSVSEVSDGTQYEAVYHSPSNIDFVRVLKISNLTDLKQILAGNLQLLKGLWTTRADTCGFYQENQRTFSWISNDIRVSVVSSDLEKIRAYAELYPSNCNLLAELERISMGLEGFCGNSIIETPEQCDLKNDSACPNACRPDCTCSLIGLSDTGVCGDFYIQQPNSAGKTETCEPVEKHDPVTGQVLSGSSCFVRDPIANTINEAGHCNHKCECVPGIQSLPKCGNGICTSDETNATCPADCGADLTSPLVTFIEPIADAIITSLAANFTINATDNVGVVSCIISVNQSNFILSRTDNLWNATIELSNGTYYANATCSDAVGNKGSDTVAFNVTAFGTTIN